MSHLSLVSSGEGGLGQDVLWVQAWREYHAMMKAAGRSPKTIRLHRHYLDQLRKRYGSPWSVTMADLLDMLSCETWGAESRKSARSVYRVFYQWSVNAGKLSESPARLLPSIRVNPGTPRPTPELIALAVMNSQDPRTAFMAMLAGYCGLRAGEIAQVHAHDWDRAARRLVIHGKGRKERVIPVVQAELVVALDAVDEWAFPGLTDGHLSSGHVTTVLSRAMPDQWTAHTLRHRAGTKAYRGTRDVLAVARMLGHSRTETTQRYVQLDDDALLDAMNAAAA